MDLVKALSSQYMKEELPEMRVGDTVRVHVRIKAASPAQMRRCRQSLARVLPWLTISTI